MKTNDPYAADIKKVNYEAMILFRDMVRQDKAEACLRLGLSQPAADLLEQATLEQLEQIADSGVLLLSARFAQTGFWREALSAARDGDKNKLESAQLRATLLTTNAAL